MKQQIQTNKICLFVLIDVNQERITATFPVAATENETIYINSYEQMDKIEISGIEVYQIVVREIKNDLNKIY